MGLMDFFHSLSSDAELLKLVVHPHNWERYGLNALKARKAEMERETDEELRSIVFAKYLCPTILPHLANLILKEREAMKSSD